VAARGILPAAILVEIGRADVPAWMRTARSVFGTDVGAFDVKSVHSVAFGERLAGVGEVAETGAHFGGVAGDHGLIEARGAGGELSAEGSRDVFVRRARVVVVNAGVAIDLEVDEGGREVKVAGSGGGRDGLDRILERDLYGSAAEDVNSRTALWGHVLFTSLPHRKAVSDCRMVGKKGVERGTSPLVFGSLPGYKRRVH